MSLLKVGDFIVEVMISLLRVRDITEGSDVIIKGWWRHCRGNDVIIKGWGHYRG